ncbi:hypothetical protein THRCLA_21951 [Thraustotheca clavata]|uniref:Uncharacterized protein n=1 Tax=Thraustotheca clavata TaxID=74557 RepID=A0A1V9ZHH4_9STRA|nr:hypothetical protein THRCLA_21951 [Thraustotheca clavata]
MSDYESEEEFVLPPGFHVAKGGAITKDTLTSDRELWLFRLPKDMDASVLDGLSFKLPKDVNGSLQVPLEIQNKDYALKTMDSNMTQQLVNLVPETVEGKKFVPGKPFTRSFSLVQTLSIPTKKNTQEDEEEEKEHVKKKAKKSKKST